MSSTVSTITQTIAAPKAVAKLRADAHAHKLVRASSIEKIKRFNTYICSQHYYVVLPALLSWLKSSQSNLHLATERTILFFRSLLLVPLSVLTSGSSSTLLRAEVYVAAAVAAAQLAFCAHALATAPVPAGLAFLLTCAVCISHLSFTSMCGSKRPRRQ